MVHGLLSTHAPFGLRGHPGTSPSRKGQRDPSGRERRRVDGGTVTGGGRLDVLVVAVPPGSQPLEGPVVMSGRVYGGWTPLFGNKHRCRRDRGRKSIELRSRIKFGNDSTGLWFLYFDRSEPVILSGPVVLDGGVSTMSTDRPTDLGSPTPTSVAKYSVSVLHSIRRRLQTPPVYLSVGRRQPRRHLSTRPTLAVLRYGGTGVSDADLPVHVVGHT